MATRLLRTSQPSALQSFISFLFVTLLLDSKVCNNNKIGQSLSTASTQSLASTVQLYMHFHVFDRYPTEGKGRGWCKWLSWLPSGPLVPCGPLHEIGITGEVDSWVESKELIPMSPSFHPEVVARVNTADHRVLLQALSSSTKLVQTKDNRAHCVLVFGHRLRLMCC